MSSSHEAPSPSSSQDEVNSNSLGGEQNQQAGLLSLLRSREKTRASALKQEAQKGNYFSHFANKFALFQESKE